MKTKTTEFGFSGNKSIFWGLLILGLLTGLSGFVSGNGNGCTPEGESHGVYPGAPQCCPGLTDVGCSAPGTDGRCVPCAGSSYCTKCGNGICGPGENKCNCPEDCNDANIIDPPLGSDVCAGQTTNVTANITINATNSSDPLLGNVSVCLNVTCPGNYNTSLKQFINLSGTQSVIVTFSITPPFTAIGQCNATTCVDCDSKINETDETDNCDTTSFDVINCNPHAGPKVPISPVAVLAVIGIIAAIAVSRIRK